MLLRRHAVPQPLSICLATSQPASRGFSPLQLLLLLMSRGHPFPLDRLLLPVDFCRLPSVLRLPFRPFSQSATSLWLGLEVGTLDQLNSCFLAGFVPVRSSPSTLTCACDLLSSNHTRSEDHQGSIKYKAASSRWRHSTKAVAFLGPAGHIPVSITHQPVQGGQAVLGTPATGT